MMVDTKLEVVAHMSTLFYRKLGLAVSSLVKDTNSYVSTLSDGTTVCVVKVDGQEKKFLCSVMENDVRTLATSVSYDAFFQSIKLPIEDVELDQLYDNYNGDEEMNYLSYLFKKFSNYREARSVIESQGIAVDHDKWNDFYSKVLVPAFLNYERTNKVDSTEQNTKASIKVSNPKFGDHPVFPEISSNTGSTSRSLPEEIPKFDDEYQMQNQPTESGPSGIAPIGDHDIHPFGKYPPMRPDLGPEIAPHSGMIPDKNHPLFQGPRGIGGKGGLNQGFGGRGDHPPGARYDDPMGGGDLDAAGMGLPGGMGLGREGTRRGGPFGGNEGNPFGGSGGFGGGFGGGFI